MNYLQIKRDFLYYFVLIATMVLVISSCSEDKSPVITQSFELETFNGVELSISGNVRIIEGQNQKVEITGRKETVNAIEKSVNDGVWDIDLPNAFHKSYDKLDIVITSNNIKKIMLSGSGNITGEHILPLSTVIISGSGNIDAKTETSMLTSTISGSGDIGISGKVDKFICHISGSGNISGFDLETTDAEISILGSGNAKIRATSNLDVTISGSGDVYYKGNPTIKTNITGSGKIINSN